MRYLLLSVLVVCMVGFMIPGAFAATYTVEIAPDSSTPGCQDTNECFIPYQLSIDAGDTVQFVNTESTATHTATSGTPADGPSGVFNSGHISIGDTFSTTFDANGTYPYYCMFHPWATGIIIVGDGISTTTEPEPTVEPENIYYIIIDDAVAKLSTNRMCLLFDTCLTPNVLYVEKGDYVKFAGKYVGTNFVSGTVEYGSDNRPVTHEDDRIDLHPTNANLMDEIGEFPYFTFYHPHLSGTIIVTEPGEYDIAEKYHSAIIKRDVLKKLTDDHPQSDMIKLPSKMVCYATEEEFRNYVYGAHRSGHTFWLDEDKQTSICAEVLEELKIVAGDSWDESFESVFNRNVIYSDEHVSPNTAFPIIEKMSEMLSQNYFVIMDTMVSDAEKTVNDDPNMALSSKADVIYDIRIWKDEFQEEHHRTTYSSFYELKRTYNTFIEADKAKIQAEIEKKAEQQAKEEIMAEISKDVESEPVAEPEPMINEEPMASSPTCGKGTVLKNGVCVVEQQTQQSQGGGCLIATAAFDSEMAPQVQFLRELRDNTVLQTESGSAFMTGFNQFYYSFSPAIADYERENPAFKEAVKITLTPLLTSLTLLQYADIDSESEMLGHGISIILLNIGMYFVAPVVMLSVCIRKISKN